MTKIIKIEGMSCGHCTSIVEKKLRKLEGVADVVMSLEEKSATVTLSGEVSDEALGKAVTSAGFDVVEIQ